MQHEGKSYYKIGRTIDLGKREITFRVSNPFLKIIAKKVSFRHEREEKEIHYSLKQHHFMLEWYELSDEQYQNVFTSHGFSEYSEDERRKNLRLAGIRNIEKDAPTDKSKGQFFHTFRKPKKLKDGTIVHRWYYYYINENGRQVQRACRGCTNRQQAENYIRNLDKIG